VMMPYKGGWPAARPAAAQGTTLMQASPMALVVVSMKCHSSVRVHVSGTTKDAGCIWQMLL
jgi:hypothetical protein